jgi:hypothetical protein
MNRLSVRQIGGRQVPAAVVPNLCKSAVGDALVVAVFAFVAAPAFGLARLNGFAVFRAVEFYLLVLFHDEPPCFIAGKSPPLLCSRHISRVLKSKHQAVRQGVRRFGKHSLFAHM